jgi:hypothetical protein
MSRSLNASPHIVACETYHEDSFTTKQLVAAGRKNLFSATFYNPNNVVVFLKFYDAATAAGVTIGTTLPKFTIPLPSQGMGSEALAVPMHKFANGIVIHPTTVQGDGVTQTEPSTGLLGFVRYK